MKTVLLLAGMLVGSASFAQISMVGKWKPVRFDMGGMMSADIKTETLTLSDSLKMMFQGDKDPEGSEKMMQALGGIMIRKMQNVQEEYTAEGVWTENNTELGKIKTAAYTFDPATNILIRTGGAKTERFTVTSLPGKLILTGDLESKTGKKGKLMIEYEAL